MRIKKYLVKSFDEALSSIKKELGDDAFIMSSKKIQKKGALNLSREEWLEVTAAVERDKTDAEQDRISPLLLQKAYGDSRIPEAKRTVPYKAVPRISDHDPLQPIRNEINELKWLLQNNQSKSDSIGEGEPVFNGLYDRCYNTLIMKGVEQHLAVRLIDNLMMNTAGNSLNNDESSLYKRLADVISTHLGKAAPITIEKKNRLVVLAGPTGVGKTTTIAKMAAYFKLLEGRNIALASMDGFRIGGIAQLRTYGDLIDIPVFALRDSADITGVLNRSEKYDLIFFDTPGFSPEDRESLEKLKQKIDVLLNAGAEIHLLLDATRKERDLKTVFGAYKKLQPSKLIFSKVDESDSIGNLFNIKIQSGLPVSYLTVGQRVPEDIEVAHPRRVASRLLGLFGSNGGRL